MKAFILTLALLLTASVASAQHEKGHRGNGGHEQHSQHEQRGHEQHGQRGERGDRGRRDHFGREGHRRLERNEIRFRHGRREIFFGGLWFGCDVYPDWVFVDDVYIEQVGELYYVHSYSHPALLFQVNVAI